MLHRQSAQQHAVEERKERGIRAQPEGEREHDDRAEARIFAQQAKAVTKVLEKFLQPAHARACRDTLPCAARFRPARRARSGALLRSLGHWPRRPRPSCARDDRAIPPPVRPPPPPPKERTKPQRESCKASASDPSLGLLQLASPRRSRSKGDPIGRIPSSRCFRPSFGERIELGAPVIFGRFPLRA